MTIIPILSTAWKVSECGVFFWSVFSGIPSEYDIYEENLLFRPITGKYGLEKAPHSDTFQAVVILIYSYD